LVNIKNIISMRIKERNNAGPEPNELEVAFNLSLKQLQRLVQCCALVSLIQDNNEEVMAM